MQRHAVHDGGHAELAHAVVQVVATLAGAQALRRHRHAARPVRQIGAGQVGRATEQLGQRRREGGDRFLAGLAAGDDGGALGGFCHRTLGQRGEAFRQIAGQAALQLGGQAGMRGGIGGKVALPLLAGGLALLARIPGGAHVFGNLEGAVRPAQRRLGGSDLGCAQRRAVAVVGTGLVRRAEADRGAAADQRRTGGLGLGLRNGGIERGAVMPVDAAHHMPAAGLEAAGNVLAEPAFDMTVDRDAVVVPEGSQLAQAPGAGQRAGLVADAFHQAAVAQEGPGAVVDDRMAWAVEFGGEQLFRQRHADRVGDALPQRAGGGLDARRVAQFRVARRAAVQLAEGLQVVDRQVVAAQVQQPVEQHRAVAVGEHEAVAVSPAGRGRVVLQVMAPERLGNVGHAHRHAGMAGAGLLDGVHRQRAQRVGQGSAGGRGHGRESGRRRELEP